MQRNTQTDISIIRHHFNAWRKENNFSRETAVQVVVETHEREGYDSLSGIRFEPNTRDTYERMRVNADRVYRWLDDESKETNLLPFNFHKSIMHALPMKYRAAILNDMYRAVGLAVHSIEVDDGELNINHHLCDIVKETAEATMAVAQLNESCDEQTMLKAEKEAGEAVESLNRFRRVLAKNIQRVRGAAAAVAHVMHIGGRKK